MDSNSCLESFEVWGYGFFLSACTPSFLGLNVVSALVQCLHLIPKLLFRWLPVPICQVPYNTKWVPTAHWAPDPSQTGVPLVSLPHFRGITTHQTPLCQARHSIYVQPPAHRAINVGMCLRGTRERERPARSEDGGSDKR